MNFFGKIARKAAIARMDVRLVQIGYALAFLVLLSGGIDIISTNAALANGNVEGNPFVRFLMSEAGRWWSVPKMVIHLSLAGFLLWLPSRRMIFSARIVIIGYLMIALNNFYHAGMLPLAASV